MNAGKNTLLLVLLIILSSSVTFAQKKTKTQLQREKQENLEKIKEVEKILSETAAKKKNSLGELSALNQRIVEQEKLITSIKSEISLLNAEIGENNDIIQALEVDLAKLKKEYTAMLFAAQKANNSTTRLTFLFSSKSFDQLMMRLRYMEQYGETRKLQADQIVKVQDELSGQVRVIVGQREEKNKLLSDQLEENDNLSNLKKQQSSLVKSLEKEEKKLKRDLDETKKALAILDKKINDLIKEEMEREAKALAATSTKKSVLSTSFEENKNKLPWPVGSGFVSQKFGRQNHPVLKGIVLQNDGVNIQTKENEKVKAVFEGEVRKVAFIPTFGSTVIIKHGEYFSVYTGLKEVFVKTGQKVTTSQEIGTVISNNDGISELRFRIHKNTEALDPQAWLGNM
ncbi:murein hydrolase activator EnvC family protein [Chryseosolibacter indicus]|uniref:Peptidoglycan DD-metalloendopeptidase family protein n=1 Tax=Chryseosolibacter indicus TaxID=2782351 RepID=A0ABS5VWH8_9BACT|nr:peptidoglycan DD-metalloendopeptidase family protein [Chryseosolibacter indicus]MBT1704356.1 peptidoglycan DD-metalloendopeptidase family protein [Chryseosolibacter indicus]